MVFEHPYSQVIIEKFPAFKDSEEIRSTCYDGTEEEPISIFSTFAAFCDFIIRTTLNAKVPLYDVQEVFDFIEEAMNSGDFAINSCASTGFLEDLQNFSSIDKHEPRSMYVNPKKFVPYLGKASIEYCKAWDVFTGVRTTGLWETKEWKMALKNPDKYQW